MRPALRSVVALVLVGAGLAGCGQDGNRNAGEISTLVFARPSEPEWLNPVAGHQHPDSDVALFRGLFRLDERNELVPDMATGWSVSDDGLVYTISLRPDVRWHDGVRFTAQDVKFTIETILDPRSHSGLRPQLKEIERVEVVDDLTVRIVLSTPLSSLPIKLKVGMIPRHVLEGKDFNTDPFNHDSPIGTGPFKMGTRKRGEYFLFHANPDYYGDGPRVDRLIYKFLPDPNVRLIQLIKGEVDVTRLNPKDVGAVRDNPDIEVRVLDSADFRVMMFNSKFPLFQDVRVRRAIQYATDRQALVDGVLLGYGIPGYAPLQMLALSDPDIPVFDNDAEAATALLREAGWTPGADGILVKDGVRLSFPLIASANDPVRQDLATMLAAQLRRVGIEVQVQVKDWKAFTINEEAAVIIGGGYADDADGNLYRYFSSRVGREGTNFSNYHNERVDQLLEDARNELDPARRTQIYRELQRELVMDPPFNFLVYQQHIYGVRKELSGFRSRLVGHGTSPLWNVEEWVRDGGVRQVELDTGPSTPAGAAPMPHVHEDGEEHEHGHSHDGDGH
jgi:peptide/nickel transport system substrate-binding protein